MSGFGNNLFSNTWRASSEADRRDALVGSAEVMEDYMDTPGESAPAVIRLT